MPRHPACTAMLFDTASLCVSLWWSGTNASILHIPRMFFTNTCGKIGRFPWASCVVSSTPGWIRSLWLRCPETALIYLTFTPFLQNARLTPREFALPRIVDVIFLQDILSTIVAPIACSSITAEAWFLCLEFIQFPDQRNYYNGGDSSLRYRVKRISRVSSL